MSTLAFAALATASCALAHLPVQEAVDTTHSRPLKIDTTVCPYDQEQAIYGSLDSSEDVDVYELEVPENSADFFLHVAIPVLPFDQSLVPNDRRRDFTNWAPFSFTNSWWRPKEQASRFPKCDGNDARPAIAVVGPGIPTDVGRQRWLANHQNGCGTGKRRLPFYIANDEGAVVNDFEEDFPYFEDFESGHTVVGVKKFVNLQPGTYKFYVWDPLGRTGNYLAIFGRNEGCYEDARGYGPVGQACYWLVEEGFNSNCGARTTIPACCCFLPLGTGVCPKSADELTAFCNDFQVGGRPLPFTFDFTDGSADDTPEDNTPVDNNTDTAPTEPCEDLFAGNQFSNCADLATNPGCGEIFKNPFAEIDVSEQCKKTCGLC